MPRKRIADLTPILTEEQRSLIRMGWRAPGKYAEGEFEAEHAQRIADRAERAGLPVNPRPMLDSTDTWLSRYARDMRELRRALKVSKRAAAAKEVKLTVGQPAEDGGPTAATVGDALPVEPVPAG
jgi:hypothetical protein